MLALIAAGDDDEAGDPSVLASIRSDVGNVSLSTMLTEIAKLEAVRAVGLHVDVFAHVTPEVVIAWHGRAAVESPSHLRDHPSDVTLTLLSALLYCREANRYLVRGLESRSASTVRGRRSLISVVSLTQLRTVSGWSDSSITTTVATYFAPSA
jgi:hypothetical protein